MGGGVRAEESPAGGAQFTVTLLQGDDQEWVALESQEPPS